MLVMATLDQQNKWLLKKEDVTKLIASDAIWDQPMQRMVLKVKNSTKMGINLICHLS